MKELTHRPEVKITQCLSTSLKQLYDQYIFYIKHKEKGPSETRHEATEGQRYAPTALPWETTSVPTVQETGWGPKVGLDGYGKQKIP